MSIGERFTTTSTVLHLVAIISGTSYLFSTGKCNFLFVDMGKVVRVCKRVEMKEKNILLICEFFR